VQGNDRNLFGCPIHRILNADDLCCLRDRGFGLAHGV
jgi:hypothetical protein